MAAAVRDRRVNCCGGSAAGGFATGGGPKGRKAFFFFLSPDAAVVFITPRPRRPPDTRQDRPRRAGEKNKKKREDAHSENRKNRIRANVLLFYRANQRRVVRAWARARAALVQTGGRRSRWTRSRDFVGADGV